MHRPEPSDCANNRQPNDAHKYDGANGDHNFSLDRKVDSAKPMRTPPDENKKADPEDNQRFRDPQCDLSPRRFQMWYSEEYQRGDEWPDQKREQEKAEFLDY